MDPDKIFDLYYKEGNPVVLDGKVYFCWRGTNPPDLQTDLNGWEPHPASSTEQIKKDFWACEVEIPPDAYVEYAYFREGHRIRDPRNKHLTPNGTGKFNHFLHMPAYHPETDSLDLHADLEGYFFSDQLDTLGLLAGASREVYYYQPPLPDPVPLLVVWDGADYAGRVNLSLLVEQLIFHEEIAPIALAMVDNGKRYRTMEYLCSEATLGFLMKSLLPDASRQLTLLDPRVNPGIYGICGASFGGLMALYTGLRAPEIFGKVLSQSGAFSVDNYEFSVWDLVRYLPRPPIRVSLDCGRFDRLLACNRDMQTLLLEKGYPTHYQEYNCGHNYPAWADHIVSGLKYLFPKVDS